MLEAAREYTQSPEKMHELFGFMSQFYQYSPRNQLLINKQYAGAKAVGSFQFFKEKGYSIKKGEKGIRIFQPNIAKMVMMPDSHQVPLKSVDAAIKNQVKAGQLETKEVLTGYHLASVFDVTQTNMPPEAYPSLYPNRPTEFEFDDDLNRELSSALDRFSKDRGIPIQPVDHSFDGAALGHYQFAMDQNDKPTNQRILIDATRPKTQQTAVRINEIAHLMMHTDPVNRKLPTEYKELQAEMVSHIVAKHYGMSTDDTSVQYIASWTNSLQKLDDEKFAEQFKIIALANKTSKAIIEKIDPEINQYLKQNRQQDPKIEQEASQNHYPIDQDVIKAAQQVDIVDFARSNGIDLEKNGKYWRGVEHDSLVIDSQKNLWKWNSQDIGGGSIDFVETFVVDQDLSKSERFKEAVRVLTDANYKRGSEVQEVIEPFEFSKGPDSFQSLSDGSSASDQVRHYLQQTRAIDPIVVDALSQAGVLGHDQLGNAVFKWQDNLTQQTVGGSVQGTTIDHEKYGERGTMKHIMKNSTTGTGLIYDQGKPENLHYFESEIDMMSYLSLQKHGSVPTEANTRYIAMDGLKDQTVLKQLSQAKQELGYDPVSVTLNVDNDEAGTRFVEKLNQKYELTLTNKTGQKQKAEFIDGRPKAIDGKDWNDVLRGNEVPQSGPHVSKRNLAKQAAMAKQMEMSR